jgi:RHS repeat-associated protein
VDTGKNLILDATAPTGAITAPAASSTVTGAVPMTGTASDTYFKEYQLHYGVGASPSSWTAIGTNPYTTSVANGTLGTWNASALANGTYTLRLRVYDKARVSSGFTEVLRTITLDNNLPTATITAPVATAYVKGTVTITGSASASSGFQSYILHYGAGCSPSSWIDIGTNPRTTQVINNTLGSWNTTSLGDGSYTIRLVTTKTGPVTKTATACVTVDNTAPVGSLTAPAANAPLGGMVSVTGSATDNLGFGDYVLEYGVGSTPPSWSPIGTFASPVSGATLAPWDTSALNGVYTLRLTVHDLAGNTPAVVTRLVYLENGRRGQESYYTRVPFDLGGGWQLAAGVANGELTLDRALFSIPSYGPPQALSLSYSSLETTADGRLGVGWSSNLTQYLTFEAGFVIWHRADGGRVPFGNVGGTWAPLGGHFETLTAGAGAYTITLKDQSTLVFADAAPGRLQQIRNRFGTALTLTWNTSSATAVDASGRSTAIAIDAANNRVTAATDSAGRAWGFGYTGTDLTSVTDPMSAVTTLDYDASHRLTSISRLRTPASGPNETILWSAAYTSGKVTSITDPVSTPSAHTIAYTGGVATVSLLRDTVPEPALANVTTYTYDPSGRVTSWTDPESWTTSQTFDAAGNLLSITRPIDGSMTATTTYTYDARGNALTETVPLDGSTSATTTMTYGAANDLLSRVEADGTAIELQTAYTYDAAGHLSVMEINPQLPGAPDGQVVTSYTYTANDQLDTETDPLGRVTKRTYDTFGNRTGETRNYVSGQPATADRNVALGFAFDQATAAGKAGLATSQTDPVAVATSYTYDLRGRQTSESLDGDGSIPALTRSTTYDQLDNLLTSVETWTGTTRATTRVYDRLNRLTSETDPAGAATATAYDAAGDPISTTTDDGIIARAFDGLGRVVEEASPNGAVTGHSYDAQGRELATVVAGSIATTTTRVFDLAGRLLAETVDDGALGLTTTHGYDSLGRETETTDPQTVMTVQNYDRVGRLVQTATDVSVTDFAFDKAGNQLTIDGPHAIGGLGPVTKSIYDALNRPVEQIVNFIAGSSAPDANLTTTTFYDAAGRTVAVRDPRETATRSVFNVRGLASQSIQNCTDAGTTPSSTPATCAGAGTHDGSTNLVTVTAYDGSGATLTVTRQAVSGGVLTEATYDAAGHQIKLVVDKGTGTLNLTTETAYDPQGRQTATRDARNTVDRNWYDADGHLVQAVENCTDTGQTVPTTNWAACAATGDHDATWNVTTTYAYDPHGNRIAETAPNGRETRYGYDGADRLVWQIENYVDSPPPPAPADVNLTSYFYYDDAGRQVAIKAPTADRDTFAVTRFVFDDLGRLVTEIHNCTSSGTQLPADPAACSGLGTANASTNVTTHYTYDAAGQRLSMTAADPTLTSAGSATVTTRYAYDGANQLCRVLEHASVDLQSLADPCMTAVSGSATANVSTRYAYDAAANLTSMLDGEGHTSSYAYDRSGRMTGRTDPNGETLTWSFDERGNRVGQVNRSDSTPASPTVSWAYDAADRMTSRTADGATVTFAYDALGNRTSADGPQGEITTTYDRHNRPLTVTAEDGSTTTYTYDFGAPTRADPSGSYTFSLDAAGRELETTDPLHAGAPFSTTYRADGQPATRADPTANLTTFGYDSLGHLTASATTAAGGSPSRAAYAYTYNQAGLRLSESSTISGDPSNGSASYSYDPLSRLIAYGPAGAAAQTYAWDAVPNRASVQVGSDPALTTTFDAANRPTADSGGGNYSHDLDGQLTARPGQRLEWDSLGRLSTVRPPTGSGTLATYTYDALDRLRLADDGSTRTRFRYVGLSTSVAQLVDDASGSVLLNVGTGWNGERLLDWSAGGTNQRVYGTNAHHDVTWTAGPTGTVSASLRYDPWGTVVSSTGSSLPPWRFQGSWFDSATDLVWVVSRWYAPNLGTFVSEDSLLGDATRPQRRHLYAYGAGEPVGRWDPDGRADIYDGRASVSTIFPIGNPLHADVSFRMALFIRAPKAFVDPFGVNWLRGDARGYSYPAFNCWQSRACIEVEYPLSRIRFTVRPSCGFVAFYTCRDAYKFNDPWGWVVGSNYVRITQERTGKLKIAWELNNSRLATLTPIDGSITFYPPGHSAAPHGAIYVTGDGYPSVEFYAYRSGRAAVEFQRREGVPGELIAFWGDWSSWYAWKRP